MKIQTILITLSILISSHLLAAGNSFDQSTDCDGGYQAINGGQFMALTEALEPHPNNYVLDKAFAVISPKINHCRLFNFGFQVFNENGVAFNTLNSSQKNIFIGTYRVVTLKVEMHMYDEQGHELETYATGLKTSVMNLGNTFLPEEARVITLKVEGFKEIELVL